MAGDRAEIGKISKMVSEVSSAKTNLLIQMEVLARWLAIIVGVISLGTFLLALLAAKYNVGHAFQVRSILCMCSALYLHPSNAFQPHALSCLFICSLQSFHAAPTTLPSPPPPAMPSLLFLLPLCRRQLRQLWR